MTTSAVIRFVERFEDDSSRFYKQLAEIFQKNTATFQALAEEREKSKRLVIRTYRETITDALEAGFAFKGLHLKDYTYITSYTSDLSYSDALRKAVQLEEMASRFYSDLAECSELLLATMPRMFRLMAEKRRQHQSTIQSLQDVEEESTDI